MNDTNLLIFFTIFGGSFLFYLCLGEWFITWLIAVPKESFKRHGRKVSNADVVQRLSNNFNKRKLK